MGYSEGVLSDSTGAVVVKPCTAAEVAFYESVAESHPDLLPHLPTFLGSLSLSNDQEAARAAADTGTITTADGAIERLHGKKLDTDLHIVLENITHGFTKPNVLDLKLGKQLWDEKAKPEKRARLDEVANSTTSGSLGFRIAGMRTWKGKDAPKVPDDLKDYVEADENGYWVYNKMYGRKFTTEDIKEGFEAYILPQGSAPEQLARAQEILAFFLGEVKDIISVFEKKESRMYSASILLVYEGDVDAYAETKQTLKSVSLEDEAEEDEEDLPKLAAAKMIDFAPATWRQGEGSDENALRGMRSTATILKDLLDKTNKELDAVEEAS